MVSVYEFSDYREFLKAWIASHEEGRRGLKSELARKMGVSSSLMSQILGGDKQLSLEQAAEAAERFGFNDAEIDFWFLLVEKDRAGTHKLRLRFEEKIRQARTRAKNLANRIRKEVELSEDVKSTYYSSWIYSGARNLSALPDVNDVETLAKKIDLPLPLIAKVVQFLLENGLCKLQDGKLTYGPAQTFTERHSPHTKKHHRNWRLRGLQMMELESDEDLFITAPMSFSRKTGEEIRAFLLEAVQDVNKRVGPSPSEIVGCLNIDWFKY